MNIQDFIQETNVIENGYIFRPRIFCKDGFNFSAQASSGHYCYPRKTTDFYSKMELGFPSEEEELLFEYAETEYNWTQTVYGWVPVEVIQEVIDKHGGIDVEKTFK